MPAQPTDPAAPSLVDSPVTGVVVEIAVSAGQTVAAAQVLVVLESMKMEVPVPAPAAARIESLMVQVGDTVGEGDALLSWRPATSGATLDGAGAATPAGECEHPRLARWRARRALLDDAARPDAVARRHAAGRRTARENVDTLLDAGSFTEYGGFAIAAQRSRRPEEELQRQTPADGLITGHGTVDGRPVAVLAYDYTVLAGTQGVFNHRKADRLLALARRERWPVVLFAEGGGGRPGDVDWLGVAGLDCTTFAQFAAMRGVVPTIGIAAGYCFAGNAALLGCCDIVLATAGSSIGMGGPAMIEGGGLGRVAPQDVGPVAVLAAAGAVDRVVADEAEAAATARRLLGLLCDDAATGSTGPGGDADALRRLMPERRNASYDIHAVLRTIFDADSVTELRAADGRALVTALARLDGRPVAVAASQVQHGAGALDADACRKWVALMALADRHGLPIVTLVDTPGFMVGPASEATGMLRHAGEVFATAAALRVPLASVVLRRGYGLGAMALTGGHFHVPVAICAWPSGEFGPMGLEGAVRLGFRKELEAAQAEGGDAAREALYERLLADAVARGDALNMAAHLEIDDVIDPADTRAWLCRVLASAGSR